ncbi:hypothetical protein YC2023_014746 [Brassica napus]
MSSISSLYYWQLEQEKDEAESERRCCVGFCSVLALSPSRLFLSALLHQIVEEDENGEGRVKGKRLIRKLMRYILKSLYFHCKRYCFSSTVGSLTKHRLRIYKASCIDCVFTKHPAPF